ncbi:hypothetical protein [Kribbella endophytica]
MPLTAHPPTAVRRSPLPHAPTCRPADTRAPGAADGDPLASSHASGAAHRPAGTYAPAPGARPLAGTHPSSTAGADRLAGTHAPGAAGADRLAGSHASGAAHRTAGTHAPAHPAAVGWLAQVPALDASTHGLAVSSMRRTSFRGGVRLCRVGRLG